MIRAVFFDLDDTLVDYDPAARLAFVGALGDDADYDQWRSLDHYDRYLRGELSFEAMRELRMADYLTMIGRHDEDYVAIERHRFSGLVRHCALFDDVLPCVAALRADGLLLGLITNNEGNHQRHKIASVGLADLFDAIVISGEVGVSKPEPAIFARACAALAVSPQDAVHVGDNIVADVRGAAGAGLHAVWLDRAGSGQAADAPVVTTLRELPSLIAALEPAEGVR